MSRQLPTLDSLPLSSRHVPSSHPRPALAPNSPAFLIPTVRPPRLAQPPPAVPILRHIELNPGAAYCFQVCLQWRCATPIILGSYFTFGLHHLNDDNDEFLFLNFVCFFRTIHTFSLSLSPPPPPLPSTIQYSRSSRISICFISFYSAIPVI